MLRDSDLGAWRHPRRGPGASPYVLFAVDDIEAAAARVQELGGTVERLDAGL